MSGNQSQPCWQAENDQDQLFKIDPAYTYGQDSSVFWNSSWTNSDGTTGAHLPLSNDTNAAYYAGEIRDLNPVQIYSDTQTPNQPSSFVRGTRKGQFLKNCTVGDAYHPYTPVYAGADNNTITSQAGTNKIGYVSVEQADIASATAGQTVLVDMRAKYPNDVAIS